MLALATGWQPDAIGDLPVAFRAACHWALFARSLAGPTGLPSALDSAPKGATIAQRLAVKTHNDDLARARAILFPEGDDGAE